jgi:hypothetical protein
VRYGNGASGSVEIEFAATGGSLAMAGAPTFGCRLLIKNTTAMARTAVVTLFAPSGTTPGATATLSIPANGSLNLQVSQPAPTGFGLASASGGVRISSTSPLGGLVANVTSPSFGSGVSFDTPATPRPDWSR